MVEIGTTITWEAWDMKYKLVTGEVSGNVSVVVE